MKSRRLMIGAALLLWGFSSVAQAQRDFGRGGHGGGGHGGGGHHGGSGGGSGGGSWRPGDDERFDRPEHDLARAFKIGVVEISRGNSYQILNTNVEATQVKICAAKDDLSLDRLDVVFGNGNGRTLSGRDYIRKGECSRWLDFPGEERRIKTVIVVGSSDRDQRDTKVVIYGRVKQVHSSRTWISWNNNQTSCGDGAGPFFMDRFNNQINIKACPDQKPNGGPIGMACDRESRGALCYGWRFQAQQGFFCSAPNGKVPPTPAYVYSIYQCP